MFNKKYNIIYDPKKIYNELIMYTLLFNKNTHLVSLFKDYMIYDYAEEFLKRFYSKLETSERLSKFAIFYRNYLSFFCHPCFKNLFFNCLVQKNRERKAELFYKKNFIETKKKDNEDEGIIEDSEEEEEEEEILNNEQSKIEKTIFNETVKKNIEKYSPINTSIVFSESETKLKSNQSGLLISFENESSLRSILRNMINSKKIKKKFKNKSGEEISTIKKTQCKGNI